MRLHRVRVSALPSWLDARKLLGEGAWSFTAEGQRVVAEADLTPSAAADLDARLRKVVLAGTALQVRVTPALSRPAVRRARLDEARRQRERSPGFSRAGVKLDDATRIGLTPERLAVDLGRRAQKQYVLDACCGAGGNAIGFARAGCRVTAIELDVARLAMAQHNARVYGVAERIEWLAGDAREHVLRVRADLWFIDVPWESESLLHQLLALRAPGQRAWAKVPAAFDPSSIEGAIPRAYFGVGEGDAQRVKFLLLELSS